MNLLQQQAYQQQMLAMQNGLYQAQPTQGAGSDNLYFFVLVLAALCYFGLQVMGSVKKIQDKKFKKLRKEIQQQADDEAEVLSSEAEEEDSSDLDEIEKQIKQIEGSPHAPKGDHVGFAQSEATMSDTQNTQDKNNQRASLFQLQEETSVANEHTRLEEVVATGNPSLKKGDMKVIN